MHRLLRALCCTCSALSPLLLLPVSLKAQADVSVFVHLMADSTYFDSPQVFELDASQLNPYMEATLRENRATRWNVGHAIAPITITEPYLAKVMAQMERDVPEWKAMWDEIRADRLPIFIGTRGTEDLMVDGLQEQKMSLLAGGQVLVITSPMDTTTVAGLVMLLDWKHIRTSLEYQYSQRLASAHHLPLEDQLLLDTQWLIIHETIHLDAFRRSRSRQEFCRDPEEGEPLMDSCVMKRQAEWHKLFGLAPPTRYGVYPGMTRSLRSGETPPR